MLDLRKGALEMLGQVGPPPYGITYVQLGTDPPRVLRIKGIIIGAVVVFPVIALLIVRGPPDHEIRQADAGDRSVKGPLTVCKLVVVTVELIIESHPTKSDLVLPSNQIDVVGQPHISRIENSQCAAGAADIEGAAYGQDKQVGNRVELLDAVVGADASPWGRGTGSPVSHAGEVDGVNSIWAEHIGVAQGDILIPVGEVSPLRRQRVPRHGSIWIDKVRDQV